MTVTTPELAVLRDGSRVQIVPIDASDEQRLLRFHATLSPQTTRLRFFTVHPLLSANEVYRFTRVDHREREAIVALSDGEIVGVARFDRIADDTAEVAFVVTDGWQGRGLGTALFANLGERARAAGVRQFVAETLAENRRMLSVFAQAGFPMTTRYDDGVVHVTIDLADRAPISA